MTTPPSADADTSRSVPTRRSRPLVVAAVLVCAATMLGLGVWAYAAPESFSQFIDYQPYNRHLVHDAGAFQIGIGVTTVLALVWSDALLVALTGFAVASGLHTISHYLDRHIGGHDGDVPSLGLLTLVALFAIYARLPRRNS